MRTETEIKQARGILQLAKEKVAARGAAPSDILTLGMFIDLLDWVREEPNEFGPELDKIRKHLAASTN